MGLFHASGYPYKIGDIIKPRRKIMIDQYQRTTYLEDWNNILATSQIESVLELTRRINTPSQPSRLHSVFCFDCIYQAASFAQDCDLNFNDQVNPALEYYDIHIGEFNILPYTFTMEYCSHLFIDAEKYWSDAQKEVPEILIGGNVRVLEAYKL